MSSTLLTEDTGVPFDELQAEQIALYRAAWSRGGLEAGAAGERHDQVGHLDGGLARFGKSYVGEPDAIAEELSQDAAVRDADTILLTVPNQLGVAYNAHLLETVAKRIAPAIGWSAIAYRVGSATLGGYVFQSSCWSRRGSATRSRLRSLVGRPASPPRRNLRLGSRLHHAICLS